MTQVISRMQEIVLEINSKLDVIQKESLSVGDLLNEANEEFKEHGKKSADFLAWCKAEFSIGKAQAYKLMKVSTFFKDDNRFTGVAMRVLYTLATEASDLELEKAAEFAESGTLTSAVVDTLLNPEKVGTPKKEENKPATESSKEEQEQQNAIDAALANVPTKSDSEEVPFDMGDATVSQCETKLETSAQDGLHNEIIELRKALQAANDMIQSMRDSKVQHNTAKEMPMLPQFTNACPYAVLGLGQLEAKQINKVKKAFRELIKCGYGNGHEAFELLTKAKDQLLADIEASK